MNKKNMDPAVEAADVKGGAGMLPPRRSQELEKFLREVEGYEVCDANLYEKWRGLLQDIFVTAEMLERHQFEFRWIPDVGELVAKAMRNLVIAADAICNSSHEFDRIWRRSLLVSESDLYDAATECRHEEGEQPEDAGEDEDEDENAELDEEVIL